MPGYQHMRFPYVCDLFGIFRDDEFTYVATSWLGLILTHFREHDGLSIVGS